jgi:tetratricopeptide (TPR) repeat protein
LKSANPQVAATVDQRAIKGIIHRDLKPSNVLVTLADGQAVAKVIDFGVAKGTNQQLTEKTLFTAYGQMIGTPRYMSPEQAEMSCLDVDTRSDVYSLGVVLYELLTGSTPLEAEKLRTTVCSEMQRLIREQEPPKPSTRLSTSGDGLTALAKHRSVSPEKLKSLVRGDLDWIVMKALEKDRNRRYESASGFAEDVGNYLQHEPIGARPPTYWYRMAKAVRRNRATIATLGVIFTVLTIALVDTLWINSKLNATVAELWDVIEERALDAAFSGNHEDADKAIQRIAKRAPTELVHSLKAINLLVAGDSKPAIEKLETVAQSQPENLMVQSVLSWAYHNAAMPGKHAVQKVKVHKLLGSGTEPTNDLEEFFILLGHFLDGSIDRKRENLHSIQSLTERHKDWGIAYALSAELQHEIAKELKSKAYFERAIDDFERAERISDSPLVARIGLALLIDYISLVDSEGHDSTSLKSKAASVAARFDDMSRIASGAEWAAKFNYLYGSQDKAEMLVESAEDHCIVKTTERNAYDRDRMRIQQLRGSENAEAKINLAMSLACSTPTPAEQQEIEAIVDDLLNDSTEPVFLVLAMDIACILKNEEMFKKVERATERWRDENFGWRLSRHVFDFYFNRISGDELLELAHPFTGDLGVAHYVIGMKCLYNQDIEKAEMHLRRTVEMRGVGQWAYHTAKLLLVKLSEEPEFRQRFAATHKTSGR